MILKVGMKFHSPKNVSDMRVQLKTSHSNQLQTGKKMIKDRILVFFLLQYLYHTSQPVGFKIWDNGPPGSLTKVLKNQISRLLKIALLFPKNYAVMIKVYEC